MRRSLLFLLFFQVVYHSSIICAQTKNAFFRKDYTYIEATQSFYKIHTIHRNWRDARKRCVLEGASLWFPEDQAEAEAVIEWWNRTQPFFHVYVGISDLISKGVYETIDGRPVTDVFSEWGPGEPNDANGEEDCAVIRREEGTLNDDSCFKKYPFICRKTLVSMEWNSNCDMPDPTYVYEPTEGKCYKFHLTPMNWTEAYSVCAAEQSYLAIINSQEESALLSKMTADAPKDKVKIKDYLKGAVHLGFHNKDDDGWKTIKGTTLEQSGFAVWGGGQPDGGANEPCGTMFYSGQLNDLSCSTKCFFICEHDIGSLAGAIDERFGQIIR